VNVGCSLSASERQKQLLVKSSESSSSIVPVDRGLYGGGAEFDIMFMGQKVALHGVQGYIKLDL
jgi:hypothetical protein